MSNHTTPSTWRQVLRQNFTRWDALADFLRLTPTQRQAILQNPRFTLNLPMRLANKIAKGTLDDPILRQFLPTTEETKPVSGFGCDPVGDIKARKAPKLLHKYQGRVLLVCTSACAMHCRFCFRQNFDYEVENNAFSEELTAIAADATIQEVILSGGDPLSLSDLSLKKLLNDLVGIPHVKRIRFHTRFPVGIPERIDDHFLELFKDISKQIWFILHSNHPLELDADVLASLKKLQKLGIVVMNQSVLLRGVNDDAQILKELCEKLVDHGIAPYYLHQLDRVQGASHFEVSEEEGKKLMQVLAAQLSGYAVPRYVREVAGEPGKTFL